MMSQLEYLQARLTRCQEFFAESKNMDLARSARQLVEAASATGQGVTLNPAQTRALWIQLDADAAAKEARRLTARAEARREAEESGKIVPFPMSSGSRVTS
jgi:hypothetical protein